MSTNELVQPATGNEKGQELTIEERRALQVAIEIRVNELWAIANKYPKEHMIHVGAKRYADMLISASRKLGLGT